MTNYRRVFLDNTYVFLTIVTFNRKPILIENIDLLRESFKNAKKFFNFEIFGIVILPDHIHMIIRPENIKEYPRIIYSLKYYVSKNIDSKYIETNLTKSKLDKEEKGVWQRRYYEHTIRDEKDLYNHLDYIHFNPIKHKMVLKTKDWEHSSFQKFIKLGYYEEYWGDVEDVKHIQHIEIE